MYERPRTYSCYRLMYRIRAIITRSWFETALDYKLRILGPTFLVYVLKWSVILTSLTLKNGVKNIQTAGYNGARTVFSIAKSNCRIQHFFFQFKIWGCECLHVLSLLNDLVWIFKKSLLNNQYYLKNQRSKQ